MQETPFWVHFWYWKCVRHFFFKIALHLCDLGLPLKQEIVNIVKNQAQFPWCWAPNPGLHAHQASALATQVYPQSCYIDLFLASRQKAHWVVGPLLNIPHQPGQSLDRGNESVPAGSCPTVCLSELLTWFSIVFGSQLTLRLQSPKGRNWPNTCLSRPAKSNLLYGKLRAMDPNLCWFF